MRLRLSYHINWILTKQNLWLTGTARHAPKDLTLSKKRNTVASFASLNYVFFLFVRYENLLLEHIYYNRGYCEKGGKRIKSGASKILFAYYLQSKYVNYFFIQIQTLTNVFARWWTKFVLISCTYLVFPVCSSMFRFVLLPPIHPFLLWKRLWSAVLFIFCFRHPFLNNIGICNVIWKRFVKMSHVLKKKETKRNELETLNWSRTLRKIV